MSKVSAAHTRRRRRGRRTGISRVRASPARSRVQGLEGMPGTSSAPRQRPHSASATPRVSGGGDTRKQTLRQTCSRKTKSAICVQRLDDSLNSAIHTRYRSLLRSSSMHEPRGPPLEVVNVFSDDSFNAKRTRD